MLEAEVHTQLREFLREQQQPVWTHHLTMARLVSRALRLRRSALIQTGSTVSRYNYSYLTPALLSEQPLLLVAPSSLQKRLFDSYIPQLQEWLRTDKEIILDDRWFNHDRFQGLLITSPESWLSDRIHQQGRFPAHIPTLIDEADDLVFWTQTFLSCRITSHDWEDLMSRYPHLIEKIREIRIKLTKSLFSHPPNPYDYYLLDQDDLSLLEQLELFLAKNKAFPPAFRQFYAQLFPDPPLYWGNPQREQGFFTLFRQPIEVSPFLSPIWKQQPFVLMGGFLDQSKEATLYKNSVGLNNQDILCLKFSPNRQNEYIRLYLPEKLPLPNTPQFQSVLNDEINHLISLCQPLNQPIVILVEDLPLQSQLGTTLAAQWGSVVQVEKILSNHQGILVCSWDFWHQYAEACLTPQLLIMATLPIPSLENPLVAGQVAYYKRKRKDWFRSYLLPTALKNLQRAVMPLRETQGLVALLDNRVNARSYGSQILNALDPYAKVNYLDEDFIVNN